MLVRCPIAQIVKVQIDDSLLLRPLHDAFAQRSATDFRKQRDNVDSHWEGNVERRTPNVERSNCRRLTSSLPLTRSTDLPLDVARVPSAPFCETPGRLTQTPLHVIPQSRAPRVGHDALRNWPTKRG